MPPLLENRYPTAIAGSAAVLLPGRLRTEGTALRRLVSKAASATAKRSDLSLAGDKRMRRKRIGPARFELATSCTPSKRATRLRHGPFDVIGQKG